MFFFIIGSFVVSLFFPPFWIVTTILVIIEMGKGAQRDAERANDKVKKEFGEKYNEEAKGNPKVDGWVILLLVIVLSLAVLTIIGSMSMVILK